MSADEPDPEEVEVAEAGAPQSEEIEPLLDYLKEARAFDFTGYKRASLTRRVRKRMREVGVDVYAEYIDLLQAQPAEFSNLFNTILINVTDFFRDRAAWDYVESSVIPRIVQAKEDGDPIRAWSAGCASGEEAYSLAILLCNALGDDQFRERVKIYGSDVDDEAIGQARQARYAESALQSSLEPSTIERYFVPNDGSMTFRKDLRRSVIFGRHDLVQDPPISRIDLLVCRNTLMYFNADIQRRILANFNFALREGGFLFLGKSEAMVTRTGLFAVDDVKHHVFVKQTSLRAPRPPLPSPNLAPVAAQDDMRTTELLHSGFEAGSGAQIVVDSTGRLVLANRQARMLFGISLQHVGRPLKDLEVSYRPVELRSRIEQVLSDRRPVTISDIDWDLPTGGSEVFEVRLNPLGPDRGTLGVSVEFREMGQYKQLREELDRSQRQLETAYEELQSTVEELETTNEELQSTNEELETTNEELHSTNEELETMNEELQSTNEELETINDELRKQSMELDQVNLFLESILGSLGSGVVVLTNNLSIRIWNREAEELWGLRSDEVIGEHFLNLDIGLPVAELTADIRRAMTGGEEPVSRTLEAINRRGRRIECLVTLSPLTSDRGEIEGVILLMDRSEADKG